METKLFLLMPGGMNRSKLLRETGAFLVPLYTAIYSCKALLYSNGAPRIQAPDRQQLLQAA